MHHFVVQSEITTPACNHPVTINFFYDKTLCFEYVIPATQTGASQKIQFELQRLQKECSLALLSAKSNIDSFAYQNLQIVPKAFKGEKEKHAIAEILVFKQSPYSVIKITQLSQDFSVTYAHMCNKNIYIAGVDVDKSSLEGDFSKDFSFEIELFKTNVMIPDQKLLCHYDATQKVFTLEGKHILVEHGHADAKQLRHRIEAVYKTDEQPVGVIPKDIKSCGHNLVAIAQMPDLEQQIIKVLREETENQKYAVIKISGLPEQSLKGNVFYRDGDYFIPHNCFHDLQFSLSGEQTRFDLKINFYATDTYCAVKTIEVSLGKNRFRKAGKTENALRKSGLKLKKAKAS